MKLFMIRLSHSDVLGQWIFTISETLQVSWTVYVMQGEWVYLARNPCIRQQQQLNLQQNQFSKNLVPVYSRAFFTYCVTCTLNKYHFRHVLLPYIYLIQPTSTWGHMFMLQIYSWVITSINIWRRYESDVLNYTKQLNQVVLCEHFIHYFVMLLTLKHCWIKQISLLIKYNITIYSDNNLCTVGIFFLLSTKSHWIVGILLYENRELVSCKSD